MALQKPRVAWDRAIYESIPHRRGTTSEHGAYTQPLETTSIKPNQRPPETQSVKHLTTQPLAKQFSVYRSEVNTEQHASQPSNPAPKPSLNVNFTPPSSLKGKEAWGPPTWMAIHTFAASYKPEKAYWFKIMLYSLVHLLACDVCGSNHARHLRQINIDAYLNSRDDAFFLTYLLHDMVNKEHGKSSPPYDQVKEWYIKNMVEECTTCGKAKAGV